MDGRDYHFLSPEDFDRRVRQGDFVEHAEYAGNRYGTLRSELEKPGAGTVLEIDVQGARQVRETLPDAVRIFVEPPSVEDLGRRLDARGPRTRRSRSSAGCRRRARSWPPARSSRTAS